MKRLPARIGLSGISFDCPDGSTGLLCWSELTVFEKTVRPNPLLRRDKDRLPKQIIASSNRISRLAALLHERQIRNEFQLGTHLQEWKIGSSRAEAVFGIFCCVGAPVFGLYFISTIAMKYMQRSNVMAEVDALMPWWYWAFMGMASLLMFSLYIVLPCLFGFSFLRSISKNGAACVITDAYGITAHLRSGEVVSAPWRGIRRIHEFPGMTLVLPDRKVHIPPSAQVQFHSVFKSAILKSHGEVGAARVFGRRVSEKRLKHPEPIPKRMWLGAACAGPMLSGIMYLQQRLGFPDRPRNLPVIVVSSLIPLIFVLLIHFLVKLEKNQFARPKKRSPLTLTACL